MKKKFSFILITFLLFLIIYYFNRDYYGEYLLNFSNSFLRDDSIFLYSGLSVFSPLVFISLNLGFFNVLYLDIISCLSFLITLIMINRYLDKEDRTKYERFILMVFFLSISSLFYRSYFLIMMPYLFASYFFFKDLLVANKRFKFIIALALMIISAWFLGLSLILALILLSIYYLEDSRVISPKQFKNLALSILIALGISLVVLLPSAKQGVIMPHFEHPLNMAIIPLLVLIVISNLKQKKKIASSIFIIIYCLIFYYLDANLLLVLIPFIFIMFSDFLKDFKIGLNETVMISFLLIFGFFLSFEEALYYPKINFLEKGNLIRENPDFIAGKNTSFIALSLAFINYYLELGRKRFK